MSGTVYHAPEGYLNSNRGLLPGTVITELRLHPFIDGELDHKWNFRPEPLKFTILAVVDRGTYRCRYDDPQEDFFWSVWDQQPRYGFMDDGSTPVRYYLPEPYPCGQGAPCAYTIRCEEIDDLALLVHDAEAFAQAAAAEQQLDDGGQFCCFSKPAKRELAAGLCPFFKGKWSDGAHGSVVCGLTPIQLHDYCELKFCELDRKVYCPIWRGHGGDGDRDG